MSHLQQGAELENQGRLDQATDAYRAALSERSDDTSALFFLARCEQKRGQFPQAISLYRRLLALQPDLIDALNNLAAALYSTGDCDSAIAYYRRALEIQPDHPEVLNNLGTALKHKGDFDAAIVSFGRSLAAKPDYPAAHWNMGLMLLMRGDLMAGWPEYEWRWNTPELRPPIINFPQPRWQGEPLSGRRILLYTEQGFGDAIQFVRYIPFVASCNGKIILACKSPLWRLFEGQVDAQIADIEKPLPEFDVHCPLMSLPGVFNTTLDTIPSAVPYLLADPTDVARWRTKLPAGDRRKIGLSWAGRATHVNDRNRSMPPAQLAPLAGAGSAHFISMQRESIARPPATLPMIDLTGELTDFAQTAALLENLDLVITVDTSVAHLAGALAKPVWVLLPFCPDWRWMLDRNDSPWYRSMRLFRQPRPGDWQTPVAQVAEALKHL